MAGASTVNELLLRWQELREQGRPVSAEELCAGRPELLDDLRRQIEALRSMEQFLGATGDTPESAGHPAAPSTRPGGETAAAGEAPLVGARYRPLRLHARGGLGEVFVARDEELSREVALKRMRRPHAGEAVCRFLREGEITGGLEHPGVVPVYGLTRDAEGQPCYAMRFIRGQTLQEAIARFHQTEEAGRGLALRQLLGRFVTVCNTVAYAHSRGVVHRDLKPSNIMLGDYGETLVVDWGMAKRLGPPGEAGSPDEGGSPPGDGSDDGTATGDVLGTPPFMSPEQAAGRPGAVGPASDIYGLGATLYALLAGRPPFDGDSVAEVLQKVQRGDFPPPRQLGPETPRALEAICLKAMAREPAARYATALELAADLERWLADEPVGAIREPLAVRARRWARKHPGPVAGLAAAVLVGLLGLAISAVILGKKNHELGLARQAEADRAEAETRANEQAQKRLAQVVKGNEILASVFHDLDPKSEEKDGKTLRVLLGERLGEAVKQLEGDAVGDPETVAQLQGLLGNSLLELGHLEEAEVVLTKARQAREQLLGADHPDTLASLNNLAALYQARGRYDDAEALYKQVIEDSRQKLGADHSLTLASLNNLAELYQARGRYDKAETLCKQVVEGYRQKHGPEHPLALTSLNNLAGLYWARGQYDEAEPLFQQVLEASHHKLDAANPLTLASMNNLAMLYKVSRRYDEAEQLYKQVIEGRRRRLGPDHADTLKSMNNLAGLYLARGRYDEAEPLCQQVLEGRRRKLGPDHADTLKSMNGLAVLYWSRKQLDRSIPLFEETLALRTKKLGPDHPDTLNTLANLGVNYRDAGRRDDGIRCLEQALATARKRPGPLPAGLAWVPGTLAESYDRAYRFDKAEALYRGFLEQARRRLGTDDPRTAGAMAQLGLNLLRQNKHAEAEKTLRDCLAIREKREPDAWTTFNTRSMLGAALLGQKQYAGAEPLLRKGWEGMKQHEAMIPPPAMDRLTEALQRLVRLYDEWGKPDEAARWRKELGAAQANPRPPGAPKP
jgi:tetratricopeptide (TPR) repeat protein